MIGKVLPNLWTAGSDSERDSIGTNHGLVVGQRCLVNSIEWECLTAAASSSTWALPSPWVDLFNVDITAEANDSVTPDTTKVWGGVTFSITANSTFDSIDVVNGTGLVIDHDAVATSVHVSVPVKDWIPDWKPGDPLRLISHVDIGAGWTTALSDDFEQNAVFLSGASTTPGNFPLFGGGMNWTTSALRVIGYNGWNFVHTPPIGPSIPDWELLGCEWGFGGYQTFIAQEDGGGAVNAFGDREKFTPLRGENWTTTAAFATGGGSGDFIVGFRSYPGGTAGTMVSTLKGLRLQTRAVR